MASAAPRTLEPLNPRTLPSKHPRDRLVRELTFFDATMLVVSSVIGVGIFLTPGTIADVLPSPGLILMAWIVGGLLSLALMGLTATVFAPAGIGPDHLSTVALPVSVALGKIGLALVIVGFFAATSWNCAVASLSRPCDA